MPYHAPIGEIMLALESAGGLSALEAAGALGEIDRDLIRAVIEEAGRFASEEIAPTNRPGDLQGSRLVDGGVVTPDGWKDVYKAWAEGGWAGLACPQEHGGQGLPAVVATVCNEIWHSANMAFGLGPLLTQGTVEALASHGSEFMTSVILPKLISGEWAGTMNLTEAQSGSDLRGLRTRAEPQGDGSYRVTGTKIFISYGDHDLTDNIVHLVLARLPDAPAGTRGISLFLVSKFLINADGSLGARNDVQATGIEEKLGIHASPTCTMTYGERGECVGHLVGEENKGLAVMFIMMNAARLGVGTQGVAIAERAYQRALAYAQDRKQGGSGDTVLAIVEHADVQRMLLTMKALANASRAICYATASAIDLEKSASDEKTRAEGGKIAALLTPVAKAYSTDMGSFAAALGIQVHGGMGYVEETGAAQYYRDAKIAEIYEGTNGIQAIDLAMRKLGMDGGDVVRGYIARLRETVGAVQASNEPAFGAMGERLGDAVDALDDASRWMLEALGHDVPGVLAGATPYLRLFGIAAGGVYLAEGALAAAHAGNGHDGAAATAHARFFAENIATEAHGLCTTVTGGAAGLHAAAKAVLAP